jgi:hypothetical protein
MCAANWTKNIFDEKGKKCKQGISCSCSTSYLSCIIEVSIE